MIGYWLLRHILSRGYDCNNFFVVAEETRATSLPLKQPLRLRIVRLWLEIKLILILLKILINYWGFTGLGVF